LVGINKIKKEGRNFSCPLIYRRIPYFGGHGRGGGGTKLTNILTSLLSSIIYSIIYAK